MQAGGSDCIGHCAFTHSFLFQCTRISSKRHSFKTGWNEEREKKPSFHVFWSVIRQNTSTLEKRWYWFIALLDIDPQKSKHFHSWIRIHFINRLPGIVSIVNICSPTKTSASQSSTIVECRINHTKRRQPITSVFNVPDFRMLPSTCFSCICSSQ